MGTSPDSTSLPAGLADLAKAVAEAGRRDEVFAAVADMAGRYIGHRLFTVMAFDAEGMRVRRLYSSNPAAYPPGGSKAKRDTPWGRLVLEQGRPFIGRGADDIRANFDDHEVILGLGLESVLNVPVRGFGWTLGTMNLLEAAGFYDESDLDWGHVLAGQLIGPLSVEPRRGPRPRSARAR
jgi:hypothetical protein